MSPLAQNATPTIVSVAERPAESDDVTVRVTGFFPSTDYAVSGTSLSERFTIPGAATHGANEFEFTATIRYRYGAAGGQALAPYSLDFPVGKFPRFARIRFSVSYVSEAGLPASAWFTPQPYVAYLYVKDPEPPRLAVDPAQPTSALPLRATLRFYHTGYHIARTMHEVDGNVIRLHQDVVYVGPAPSPNPLSEAVVTHEIGALAAGNYTIEWRQSSDGGAEQLVATLPITVLSGGPCGSCVTPDALLPLERTSVAFDSIPLGEKAGTQSIALTPTVLQSDFEPPPVSSMILERMWTNNADYLFSHDCPAPPGVLLQGRSCTVTVSFNPTLHGDSPGRLFVRYKSTTFGTTATASAALSGRAMLARGINFIPGPTTPDTAVEYYAPSLQHYFFTSSPLEQALIDAGNAGAWQRTGVTFPVGGQTDVCRFYGDRSGPNSHFYTGSAAECQSLRAIDFATPLGTPAWRYEGVALKAEVPLGVTGITPPAPPPNRPWCRDENSRRPVYRLYNDGADKRIDSNHRHVPARGTLPPGKTGEDIVREMMGQGWIYEGNALCN